MYLGNAMLLILDLPLIPLWVRVLKIPPILLNGIILIFCIIGSYSLNQEINDVYLLIVFGLVGFVCKKLGYEPAPLILAFILGPKIEISLRQTLIMAEGDFTFFVTRPISAFFLAVALLILAGAVVGLAKNRLKDRVQTEDF